MMTLKFDTDNAAFDTEENPDGERLEAARIFRAIADKLESGTDYGSCIDSNGNKIGDWSL